MKIFSKNPIKGTELKLNKPICNLRLRRLITRQEAKEIREFRKTLSKDGIVGGVFKVDIKKGTKLTGQKLRRWVNHRGEAPGKNRAIQGADIFDKSDKTKLKETLESGYGWYKAISKPSFPKVFEEIKKEAIENQKRNLWNLWKIRQN